MEPDRITDIKLWLTQKKVLFVTNSILMPGSVFTSSLKTYIDRIPVHNFTIIPGLQDNKLVYGLKAFLQLVTYALNPKHPYSHFDYVIYIDEDCFITDFDALIESFNEFSQDDRYVIGGPCDGGVFCHRTGRHNMVNTFLSYWNLKLIREKADVNSILDACKKFDGMTEGYSNFVNTMISSPETDSVLLELNKLADKSVSEIEELRKSKFGSSGEVPYCNIVRNDPDNPVEKSQVPYSYYDVTGKNSGKNLEPYYILEQALIYLTKKSLFFIPATDKYDPELPVDSEKTDNSGLTSEVYLRKDGKYIPFAVHTWFARAYSRWPVDNVMRKHTNRINKIITENNCL